MGQPKRLGFLQDVLEEPKRSFWPTKSNITIFIFFFLLHLFNVILFTDLNLSFLYLLASFLLPLFFTSIGREIRKQRVKFSVCNPTFVTQGDIEFVSPSRILEGGREGRKAGKRGGRVSLAMVTLLRMGFLSTVQESDLLFFCILTFLHENK